MAHLAKRPLFRLATLAAVGSALLIASCGDGNGPSGTNPPGDNRPPGYQDPGNKQNPGSDMKPAQPGQTDFTTEEAGGNVNGERTAGGIPGSAVDGAGTAAPTAPGANAEAGKAAPPAGRLADVEEADIYKVDQNRLFYLNTYRGFMIYDVNDTKQPKRVSRLPVYGYPVEMFVSGNTVYALLRDALYLSQVGDKLQFERHNVSQLVVIDIADIANPKVIRTIDIKGQLREGVARKVENTIYVVSYSARNYYWGWRQEPSDMKERASVYSFNVANPADVQLVEELPIFEGGSINVNENGYSYNRNFSNVAISATANALMVVENWSESQYQSGSTGTGGSPGSTAPAAPRCGSSSYSQFARVSVVDISNPSGDIKLQARFRTEGALGDQFKMTYVHDQAANTGTFYGIFARQVWASAGNCTGGSYTQNMFESWDVSVPMQPRKLDELQFGKPNETVRGSTFDVDRKVAYAITAQRIDPLYALGFANREDLKKLSEIDGLSGDMTVFRLVGDKKFLLAVGQDASIDCTGFQETQGWRATKMAVSLIDVQDLAAIKLVQRQCVAVKNAEWIGSAVSQNLDQAHKMLGMHFDGAVNVITVPVHYSKRIDNSGDWWGYRWETAVGMMTWDLKKYDPAKSHLQQTVISNHGTFIHPHGEVTRSIVFTHQGTEPRRMMINLSDTHISIANLVDINNPTAESEVEVAPFYNQIYRFGDYLVEQVQGKPQNWGSPSQELATFRVKKAGGNLEETAPVASFEVGQVYRVLKHNDSSLVLFRQIQNSNPRDGGVYVPPTTEALVVDMRNPAAPRMAGKVTVPTMNVGYYPYWCGMGAYYGGFWFNQESNFATTERGLAFYSSEWVYQGPGLPGKQQNRLIFLDLRDPNAPKVSEKALPETIEWGAFGLVADPVNPTGFYVTNRQKVGEHRTAEGVVYARYKYFAQRWEPSGETWAAGDNINIPGRLIRTWRNNAPAGEGSRMFLTQDMSYRSVGEGMERYWVADYRLSLLRQVAVAGKPAAELLDVKVLGNLYPSALLVADDKLMINGRQQLNYWYGWGGGRGEAVGGVATSSGSGSTSTAAALPAWETTSDRLLIFDLSGNKLTEAYNQATRMYNVQLMGTHAGKLFVNLTGNGSFYKYAGGSGGGGDGILVIDISNPGAPKGLRFLRTLGYATHLEFFGQDLYVASGHFGLFHLNLDAPADLPVDPIM